MKNSNNEINFYEYSYKKTGFLILIFTIFFIIIFFYGVYNLKINQFNSIKEYDVLKKSNQINNNIRKYIDILNTISDLKSFDDFYLKDLEKKSIEKLLLSFKNNFKISDCFVVKDDSVIYSENLNETRFSSDAIKQFIKTSKTKSLIDAFNDSDKNIYLIKSKKLSNNKTAYLGVILDIKSVNSNVNIENLYYRILSKNNIVAATNNNLTSKDLTHLNLHYFKDIELPYNFGSIKFFYNKTDFLKNRIFNRESILNFTLQYLIIFLFNLLIFMLINRNAKKKNNMILAFLNSVPISILINDDKTNVIFANDNALNITKYSFNEIKSLKCIDIFGCTECDIFKLTHKKGESKINIKDNKKIPIYKTSINLKLNNKNYCASAFLDISNIIDAKERAERANKIKSDFISNISHELRTPMTAIISISDMLKSYDSENLTKEQSDKLRIIHESGNRLLTFINEILDLSKLEMGKIKLNIDNFSVDELLKNVENIMKNYILKSKVEMFITKAPDVPSILKSDMQKIFQILINLLSNSVKFTNQGYIKLYVEFFNNNLLFRVIDTGIGIDEKYMKFIFDDFEQVDTSINKQYKGSGLGLSLTKKLVNLLKGQIQFHSELNKGTNVSVLIPVKKTDLKINIKKNEINEKKIETKKENTINKELQVKSTLIISNSDILNFFIRELFENRDTEIQISDLKSAKNYFVKSEPDLIILNMSSNSSIDEIELFKYFKAKQSKEIKYILLTKELENPKILSGYYKILKLPLNPDKLNRILENIV